MIRVAQSEIGDEALIEAAIESGADDVTTEGGEHVVVTAPDQLFAVGDALRARGVSFLSQQLVQVPLTVVAISDSAIASQVIRLYDALDELDDVQNVYANFEISEDAMPAVSALDRQQ
jgi:transcriptional/translational regulatory protein YebC/TACO1